MASVWKAVISSRMPLASTKRPTYTIIFSSGFTPHFARSAAWSSGLNTAVLKPLMMVWTRSAGAPNSRIAYWRIASLTVSSASTPSMVRRVIFSLTPERTWMSEPSAPTTQGTPSARAVRSAAKPSG